MKFTLNFDPIWPEIDAILEGILLTIGLSAGAIILGSMLAVLLVALKSLAGRWVGLLVDAYVELMRNTPFLIQLFMIFFGLPLLGIRMSGTQAGLLAMTMNLGAYAAEIIRAGVESTHRSQLEAGVSLALTRLQVFRYVVLKPALAKVWPALTSQFVLMMLASSICSFISVAELSGVAAIIESRTFRSFEIYIIVTLTYLVMALALKSFLLALGKRLFPNLSGVARINARGSAV
ncbi:MAG: amino acid ABC transporter permease [Methylocystis sp.]|nr:amino acid ABC transporter permease [Methylocystis sp.]MCA3585311.1 amino acid ABC transporter permease [Methylocystis sp.]MCA3587809.1 amino acid ABC transporter permease [Methylocystis sp.]MCA3593200.1 amino acid ABC transporter permease [Methylocystis sp.]